MESQAFKISFDEFLKDLSLNGYVQSYFDRNKFFRILFIDTINSKICLSVDGFNKWFGEDDFLENKLCR